MQMRVRTSAATWSMPTRGLCIGPTSATTDLLGKLAKTPNCLVYNTKYPAIVVILGTTEQTTLPPNWQSLLAMQCSDGGTYDSADRIVILCIIHRPQDGLFRIVGVT